MRAFLFMLVVFSVPAFAQVGLNTAVAEAERTGQPALVTYPEKAVQREDGTTAVPAIYYEPRKKSSLFTGATISVLGFHVEKSREEATEHDQSVIFGLGPTIGVLMLNDRVEPYAGYFFGKGEGNRGRVGGRLYLHRADIKGSTVDNPAGAVYIFGESAPATAPAGKPDVRFSTGIGFNAFSDEDDGFAGGFRLELGRTFYKSAPGIKSGGYRFYFGWVVQGGKQ
jgi:hypothetical protein